MDPINLGEMFLDDNYSIEALLAQAQEHKLNLVELRDRLQQYQQDLNQTSLELFNNSYDRFYKLSYIISCLAEPIQHLIEPLQSFRDQLGDLCKNHDAYVDEINNKLGSLEETGRNKELAQRLIILIQRRDRIEKQMEKIDWSIGPMNQQQQQAAGAANKIANNHAAIGYQIKCDLLERVTIELHHLVSEVRAIEPTHDELIPIKKSLESSLAQRQCRLDKWFENAFLQAIEAGDRGLIDLIVRTYKQKDDTCKLDTVWLSKVVRPYLNLALNESLATEQIGQTYNLLDQFISNQLDLIRADFVVSSFWQGVVDSLERLERVYSLNELETFQMRYIKTRAFLHGQKNYIIGEEGVQIGISEGEARSNTQRILGKFNLKGYFNHRLSQVAQSAEASLANQPLTELPIIDQQIQPHQHLDPEKLALSQFRLRICMHIYALVSKCWSPDLYIDTLELSFSQLACRIINRFADWLGKLRLSDFRITGPPTAASESNKQTNFLAKQDAIMRLLIEDCGRLVNQVNELISKLNHPDSRLVAIRKELVTDSFNRLNNGLSNVQSLQRLIAR